MINIIDHDCAVKVIIASQQIKKLTDDENKRKRPMSVFIAAAGKIWKTKYEIHNMMLHELNKARKNSPHLCADQ